MVICAVQEVPFGCLKISTTEEPSFFIRESYLSVLSAEKLENLMSYSLTAEISPLSLSEEEELDITRAKNAYLAEKCAVSFISRAEQCRYMLSRKLEAKGFDKMSISKALDYLEAKNILDDYRYSLSYLHSRAEKREGRLKMMANLSSRGIKKDVAVSVIDTFFSERSENDENEKCKKEYKKLKDKGLEDKKIYDRLCRLGFSSKIIRETKRSL